VREEARRAERVLQRIALEVHGEAPVERARDRTARGERALEIEPGKRAVGHGAVVRTERVEYAFDLQASRVTDEIGRDAEVGDGPENAKRAGVVAADRQAGVRARERRRRHRHGGKGEIEVDVPVAERDPSAAFHTGSRRIVAVVVNEVAVVKPYVRP